MIYSLVEPAEECLGLLLYRCLQPMFDHQADILAFVIFGDGYARSTFLQVDYLLGSKLFSFEREVQL